MRALSGGRPDLVALDPDHPGFRDPAYRARRNALAALAHAHEAGDPLPHADYTEDEHRVWGVIRTALAPLHARYACAPFRRSEAAVALGTDAIPQLAEVDRRLQVLSGMRLAPVAGLIASRDFLESLGRSTFLATQYIRHPSRPFYTPEPDVVHELIGHAITLADPDFVALNRAFGAAVRRADEATLERIARIYWYTLEFGAVREDGALKVYGAGLLSSVGELTRFAEGASGAPGGAALRPLDFEAMAAEPYDPTSYQPHFYVAPSFATLVSALGAWLEATGR